MAEGTGYLGYRAFLDAIQIDEVERVFTRGTEGPMNTNAGVIHKNLEAVKSTLQMRPDSIGGVSFKD